VKPSHFTPRHADLVSAFAGPVALALHHAQVYEQVRQSADEISMFYEIGMTITAGLDMDSLLEKLYNAACRLAPVDGFYLAWFDEDTQQAMFPIFIDNGVWTSIQPFPINESSLTGRVIKNKKTLYIPDLENHPDRQKVTVIHTGSVLTHSYVGIPLIVRDKVLGVMSLQSYAVDAYTPDQIRLFETLASQAIAAIENSRLFQQVNRELSLRQRAEQQLSEANQRLLTQLTEIQGLQESLREQAIRDSLTGLFNRRFMEVTFTQELARAEREGEAIGVILLDIDEFKIVNDTFGHAAGDATLVALAEVLVGRLRSSDTVCRYGGEEFLLVLPGSGLETSCRRAEDLRRAVEEMAVSHGENRFRITVSLGVAAFPEHGREMDVLIRHADDNLYRAKNAGRNQVAG
jgi:diguanylate cyclase (GGDEF)-like protein